MSKYRKVIVCRPRKAGKTALGKQERKALHNFSEYLRGVGGRCPRCLHKSERHGISCSVRGCDCKLTRDGVLHLRETVSAAGWAHDPEPMPK